MREHPTRRLFYETIADFAIRDVLLRHAEEIQGRVLDLGCGSQPYKFWLNGTVKTWIGLDWPDGGHPRGSGADIVGDALALPFEEESFDTVVCTQVLEHVPEPLILLCEALRVLRPGGKLVLTAPQYNGLHSEPRDFYRYTRYGLDYLARKAGLTVRCIEPVGGFLTLFAFITVLHVAPLRIRPISGMWQWLAWRLDRVFYRPKDCLGYLMVAERREKPGCSA
jgi:SAM-dependent methyltransferase